MNPAFSPELADRISGSGIIAVLVIEDASSAVPLAQALLRGGVTCMELTLRTPAAFDALDAITAAVPEMIAGVGTVLFPEQVREAVRRKAAFAVAPGVNRKVLEEAASENLSFAPGIATPSDIETALEYNCRLLKFFPSEPLGGLGFLRTIAAPYAHLGMKFIPLGGINETNLPSYSSDPLVSAVGGSWLAPKSLIHSGDWAGIENLAQSARNIIAEAKK